MVTVPTIELREHQKDVFWAMTTGPYKRGLYIANRRSGKDIVALEIALANALMGKPGTILYFNPTYRQIKNTVWTAIADNGIPIRDMVFHKDLVKGINHSDMSITLINGSVIKFLGSDSYDTSAVGANAKMVIFSEWSLCDPRAWDYVRPIVAMNGGKAFFIGTPRSRNHMYDMYLMALNNKDWYVRKRGYLETKTMTQEQYDKEIENGMPETIAQQEFNCSFDVANEGTYYGKEVQHMRNQGRICSLPIDYNVPVCTAWDLGISDATAIIFYQHEGDWVNIIDYYESNGSGLGEYTKVLKDKGYIYEHHYFPHDVNNRELGTGETRLIMLSKMGIQGEVVPMKSINYGIECVHRLMPRLRINLDTCAKLIKNIELYHKRFDEKNNVYLDTPVHDESSHACLEGDTLVDTKNGKVKIKDIKTGDYVKLDDNTYAKVTASCCTGYKNTIKIIFKDGSFLECTPDHKIFSTTGLFRADALSSNSILITMENQLWKNLLKNSTNARESFISNIMEQSIGSGKEGYTVPKSVESKRSYTTSYTGMENKTCFQGQSITTGQTLIQTTGKTLEEETFTESQQEMTSLNMMGSDSTKTIIKDTTSARGMDHYTDTSILKKLAKFLKTILFTTLTTIKRIITFPISLLCHQVNIQRYTGKKKEIEEQSILEKASRKLEKQQKNGTVHQKVSNGIRNMQKTKTLDIKHTALDAANIVGKSISEKPSAKDFAVKDAKYSIIKIIQTNEVKPVYNITVEGHHCFFANGVLVSNCDSLRMLAIMERDRINSTIARQTFILPTKSYDPFNP